VRVGTVPPITMVRRLRTWAPGRRAVAAPRFEQIGDEHRKQMEDGKHRI
jgi:hypothetical protein